jgi:hypothetical protein
MIKDLQPDGQWNRIADRIGTLWVEILDDGGGAMGSDLHDIAGIIRMIGKEFGLAPGEAEQIVQRWRVECLPGVLVEAQWARFREVMADRWSGGGDKEADFEKDQNARRLLVIRDVEELIPRFADRHGLSEDGAARQINEWLSLVRAGSGRRPILSITTDRKERG